MSAPALGPGILAHAAGFLLLPNSSLPPKDKIWSPPSQEEVTRLSIQATQGATENERAAAVSKLGESILLLSAALSKAQEAQRLADEHLTTALLRHCLTAPGVKDKDLPPDTQGPGSANWANFVEWEMRKTLPATHFTHYPQLVARRDNFRITMLKNIPLSQLAAELSKLMANWRSDQRMVDAEKEALQSIAAENIRLRQNRDAAVKEIQTVGDMAIADINSICTPFTELVALCAEAEHLAATLNLSSLPTSDQMESLQYRFKSFIANHPNLFTEDKEDKEIKEKARQLRASLCEMFNGIVCKWFKRNVELELFANVRHLNCPLLDEVLQEYFLLLEETRLWKVRQSLQDPQITLDSADLLNRSKKLQKKWKECDAAKAKEVINGLPKLMPEDPKAKYKGVLNAPLLSFTPEEKTNASKQLQVLHEEIIHRCQCVKYFKDYFKLDEDLHILDLLQEASNMPFAELVVRMIFLLRDMQRCKDEYKGDKTHLGQKFTHFIARYKQLEERMHEITEANFKKWQEEIQKAVNAQKVHWELRDIHKIGYNLSFEMRHFQRAEMEGKFSFVTVQYTKELFSKPSQFTWRGAVRQPESGSQKDPLP